jgi:hypothetical protein
MSAFGASGHYEAATALFRDLGMILRRALHKIGFSRAWQISQEAVRGPIVAAAGEPLRTSARRC